MPVAPLLAEHRRILTAVDGLEALVAGPRPDRVEGLSGRRWAFTRDLLLHFSHVEALVHAPLLADRRPAATIAAAMSRDQTARLIADFRAHTARWHGFPVPAEWNDYRLVIDHLMGRIRARLAAQEHSLYPLLPADPLPDAPPRRPINYAGEAWAIRKLIYGEDGTPIEDRRALLSPWSALPAFATAENSAAQARA